LKVLLFDCYTGLKRWILRFYTFSFAICIMGVHSVFSCILIFIKQYLNLFVIVIFNVLTFHANDILKLEFYLNFKIFKNIMNDLNLFSIVWLDNLCMVLILPYLDTWAWIVVVPHHMLLVIWKVFYFKAFVNS